MQPFVGGIPPDTHDVLHPTAQFFPVGPRLCRFAKRCNILSFHRSRPLSGAGTPASGELGPTDPPGSIVSCARPVQPWTRTIPGKPALATTTAVTTLDYFDEFPPTHPRSDPLTRGARWLDHYNRPRARVTCVVVSRKFCFECFWRSSWCVHGVFMVCSWCVQRAMWCEGVWCTQIYRTQGTYQERLRNYHPISTHR